MVVTKEGTQTMSQAQTDAINKWYMEQQKSIREEHEKTMQTMQERMKSLQDMLRPDPYPTFPEPEPEPAPEPMPEDPFVGILLRLDQLEAEIRDIRGLPPVEPSINNDHFFGSKS